MSYFTTTKKGEIYELKSDLNSDRRDKKKEAVKRVIASMTIGKDVSSLFADVLKCMQTDDLELKKLVYLYLMNHAKNQPDLVILAVNSFVRDMEDPNPLLRALAIRTISCMRVERVLDYVCEPLRKCMKDPDPYVRKTAVICVAKLYDINPELAEDSGLLETLKDTMLDGNPVVIANTVASLSDIYDMSHGRKTFTIDGPMFVKLLVALNECTEWGQIMILDGISKHGLLDPKEAENVIEQVLPRLQHANAGVVMSAVRVVLKYLDLIENPDYVDQISQKLSAPLISLLSAESEIQYVALRNINLILRKRPRILKEDVRMFFCKYNDAPYVKWEKLEIMVRLASPRNIDYLLGEWKE
jgi:AP-1 complex subunit beta-1